MTPLVSVLVWAGAVLEPVGSEGTADLIATSL
jgi:hypothetical protein